MMKNTKFDCGIQNVHMKLEKVIPKQTETPETMPHADRQMGGQTDL